MSLKGKRVAILVEQDFEDIELAQLLNAMRNANAEVIMVGSGSRKVYRGLKGEVSVTVDISARKASGLEFDAVIVPGGYAADKMRLYRSMVNLVKNAHLSGKIVGAVDRGPQLLISADIVKGRRVTSWPSVAVDLRNAGANWVDETMVRDGNIITFGKPADLSESNRVIIQAIEENK